VTLLKKIGFTRLPRHVAIIVDGNRRWARKRGLPALAGHRYVTDKILEPLIYRCLELSIPYITFWAFSTENWKRGPAFARALFGLLRRRLQRDITRYNQAGMQLNTIGDLTKLPKDLVKVIEEWKQQSRKNTKITVTIALNYGGRDEVLRAVRRASISYKLKAKSLEKIAEEEFSQYLDTANPPLPDVDLVIRTGGEQRLSGFMPWQTAYAEFYFPKTLMPDFTVKEFDKALREYQRRDRRLGGDSLKR
jgi:undecaprenyl diphosphate synthase